MNIHGPDFKTKIPKISRNAADYKRNFEVKNMSAAVFAMMSIVGDSFNALSQVFAITKGLLHQGSNQMKQLVTCRTMCA